MPFDGIVAKGISTELNQLLVGARIEKIFMPERLEIVFSLRTYEGNLRLSFSINSSLPYVALTTSKKENPSKPPMFCMLLRKYLGGGKIRSVETINYDRIFKIDIESVNELGDLEVKTVYVELLGKLCNFVLVNHKGIIIDSLVHVDRDMSTIREVMPARPYELPEFQDKLTPDDFTVEKFVEQFRLQDKSCDKAVLSIMMGFSPILAKEVCFRTGIDKRIIAKELDSSLVALMAHKIKDIVEQIKNNSYTPHLYFDTNETSKPVDYHVIELSLLGKGQEKESGNHAIADFLASRHQADRLKQSKSALLKKVNSEIDKISKKQLAYENSINDTKDYPKMQHWGELLTANLHALKLGMKEARVIDYYDPEMREIVIPLENNLSPQKNAQKYYKKYSKYKKTFEMATDYVTRQQKELDYLESVIVLIENTENVEDLQEIKEELARFGYIKFVSADMKKGKAKEHISSGPHKYISSDGTVIFAGKNNKQNDLLTLKSSNPKDIWLHTQKIHGSHVIIKCNGREPSSTTLEQAAMIAAHHSKGKASANVPVDYTFVKNVKKPTGAKPGMVIYDNFKTIFITPDSKLLENLKEKE